MKTNKKIKIFYHIFLEKNWNKIVEEQIKTLVNSGILNFSEFNVGVVYGYGYDKENALNLLKSGNFNLLIISESASKKRVVF